MRILCTLSLLAAFLVGGCGSPLDDVTLATQGQEIAELATAIRELGPEVDPEEADRAAHIAFTYARQLAVDYEVTDPPVIHNTKVNLGLRSRGLCYQWAEDMEARLRQEDFQTLDLHRAIAPPRNMFRLEHSTAIISRKGDTMFQGLVIDPWREGGQLYWAPVPADPAYDWRPREEVLRERSQTLLARAALDGAR